MNNLDDMTILNDNGIFDSFGADADMGIDPFAPVSMGATYGVPGELNDAYNEGNHYAALHSHQNRMDPSGMQAPSTGRVRKASYKGSHVTSSGGYVKPESGTGKKTVKIVR